MNAQPFIIFLDMKISPKKGDMSNMHYIVVYYNFFNICTTDNNKI